MINNTNSIKHLFVTVVLLLNFSISTAQLQSVGYPDPQLSPKDNDYMDRQAKVFLDTVSMILAKYPPAIHPARERNYAMFLMDAVFHDKYAAFRKPAQVFFQSRIDRVVEELETTEITSGAQIWKIYNMGFIVRTRSVTIAFDLVSGIQSKSDDFKIPDHQMKRLIKQCDILFISHRHSDHAERQVIDEFRRLGRPVLAPEQLSRDRPEFSGLIHPEIIAEKEQKVTLSNNIELRFINYPGHQMANHDNNVVLVTTPEGISIAHNGDQINEGDFMVDFDWIDKVSQNHKVDILISNAWTTDIFRIVKGFNPKLVIPGHQLELGHTVWDRLPYWGDDEYLELNYAELKKSRYPVVVMMWGESYHYFSQ